MAQNLVNRYGIYISEELSDGMRTFRFPVNPEEIKIDFPQDNKTYNILDLGEIVVPRTPKLMKIQWKSFFPGESEKNAPYVLTQGKFELPAFYINRLNDICTNKTVVRLTIERYYAENGTFYSGGEVLDTNILVIVQSFKVSEKGGETGDFYYEIEFVQYRSYLPDKVTIMLPTHYLGDMRVLELITENPQAISTSQREINTKQITKDCLVLANGKAWYSSYGQAPAQTINNITGRIIRIEDLSRPKPYLFSQQSGTGSITGWMSADELIVMHRR